MFTDNMIALHSVKIVRNSRSIMSTSLQIAKALMSAANTINSSILQNVIDTARKTSITLLHQLSSKISAAGITSKVVQKSTADFHPFNIEKFLTVTNIWQNNYTTLEIIKRDYDIFIDQLISSSHNLQKYYLQLFSNEMPMTEKTLQYLGNHSYVFTAYIKEGSIVRQFIKTQISSYSALQSTVIPIKDATFHRFYYWQTDMFRGKTFKRSNHCLIRSIW